MIEGGGSGDCALASASVEYASFHQFAPIPPHVLIHDIRTAQNETDNEITSRHGLDLLLAHVRAYVLAFACSQAWVHQLARARANPVYARVYI